MKTLLHIITATLICNSITAQLFVTRDTISVIEAGKILKMPWANGLNYTNISNIDLNLDGKKDVVAFDKLNQFGIGKMRCFIHTGMPGEVKYRSAPELSYSFPPLANWAVCKDYNCDGKEDLFCSTTGGIMVYQNVSTPTLGLSFVLIKSLLNSDFQGTNANLFAAVNGVPGIEDVDGDGDLDILTFSPQGVFIEYHKNTSIETYGNCDSLNYTLATGCWGKIIENNCQVNLNQACTFRTPEQTVPSGNSLHAGSCLTIFDSDGDGDKDVIIGDISCNIVQYMHNGGDNTNALIIDTTKLYPNYPNKGNTLKIQMNNFPGAYIADVDGDGKNDLVATPGAFGGENSQSLWYYKNASITNTVNFQFVKKNLLQDEMIEVGQNSYPVLFDYNSDGKKDLLVGTFGYSLPNALKAQLTLYENIGSLAQPIFSLITRDYAGVSTQSLSFVIPTVGDVDGDNDLDILIGTSNGKVHWLKNSAGAGNTCNFSSFLNNPFNFTTQSAVAAVQLFDINKDGKLDLLIGGKNGKIAYYANNGTTTSPSFSLITNSFGNVQVQAASNLYGIDGYASPFFYNEGNNTMLLVGSISGQIFHYSVPADITASCFLLNANVNNINEGGQSTVFFDDINNDNKRDLFIGNAGGGLGFFSSQGPEVSISEQYANNHFITLFPVPASESISLSVKGSVVKSGKVIVYDMLGKPLINWEFNTNFISLNISELSSGIYFARIIVSNGIEKYSTTRKIIKE